MQQQGYRIIPVNPNESEVLGEKCYARLEDIPEHIDIVDIFRRSEFVAPVVESAIRIGAAAVWMQEGVVDEAAARKATRAGTRGGHGPLHPQGTPALSALAPYLPFDSAFSMCGMS